MYAKSSILSIARKDHAMKDKHQKSTHQSQNSRAAFDSRAAQRVILTCANEVLNRKRVIRRVINKEDIEKINEGESFLDRALHPHMDTIPSLSEYRHVRKSHSTDKLKKIALFCKRMANNEPNFVRMRLGCEEIDDFLLRQISNSLKKNSYGRELLMYNNIITDEGISWLADALRSHPSIYRVSLGGNLLSDVSANALADVCHQNPKITQLNISNKWPKKMWSNMPDNPRYPRITSIGAGYFASRLAENGCRLMALYLGDQRIGDEGAVQLFSALKTNHFLQILSLDRNNLTDACCEVLKLLMWEWDPNRVNPKLTQASKSDVTSDGDGGSAIPIGPAGESSSVFAVGGSIDMDTVASSGINSGGSGGGVNMNIQSRATSGADINTDPGTGSGSGTGTAHETDSTTFGPGCRLLFLSLQGNLIGDSGAMQVADGLGSQYCLMRVLDLSTNIIGHLGMRQLFSSMQVNTSLCLLNLRDNSSNDIRAQEFVSTRSAMRNAAAAEGLLEDFQALYSAYAENEEGGQLLDWGMWESNYNASNGHSPSYSRSNSPVYSRSPTGISSSGGGGGGGDSKGEHESILDGLEVTNIDDDDECDDTNDMSVSVKRSRDKLPQASSGWSLLSAVESPLGSSKAMQLSPPKRQGPGQSGGGMNRLLSVPEHLTVAGNAQTQDKLLYGDQKQQKSTSPSKEKSPVKPSDGMAATATATASPSSSSSVTSPPKKEHTGAASPKQMQMKKGIDRFAGVSAEEGRNNTLSGCSGSAGNSSSSSGGGVGAGGSSPNSLTFGHSVSGSPVGSPTESFTIRGKVTGENTNSNNDGRRGLSVNFVDHTHTQPDNTGQGLNRSKPRRRSEGGGVASTTANTTASAAAHNATVDPNVAKKEALAAILSSKKSFREKPPMALTPLFPPTPYSADIGKTIGIPKFGHKNDGAMPVRTMTSRFVDSMQHQMYLRVSTAEDPPDMRPRSVVMIGKDHKDTVEAVKKERQSEEYKMSKMEHMAISMKNQRQRAAVKPPPDEFWKMWKDQMNSSYPRGIDRAKGITSTSFDPDKAVVMYDQTYIDRLRANSKFRKGELKMGLLKSTEEAFVHHRIENMVKNEKKKIQQQRAEEALLLEQQQQQLGQGQGQCQGAVAMVNRRTSSLSMAGSLSSDPFKDMSLATKDGFMHMFGFKEEDSEMGIKGPGKSQRGLRGKTNSSKTGLDKNNGINSYSSGFGSGSVNGSGFQQQQQQQNATVIGTVSATSSLTSMGASATSMSADFPKGRSRSRVSFMLF